MNAPRVKLITGLIFREVSVLSKAESALIKLFGNIDFESPPLAFNHTDYYQEEFGNGLKRKFLGFRRLIPAQNLARIKIATNNLEQKLSRKSRRLVNIDPGYLDLAKLILASTKDYRHRIYLEKGVYAEITLFYQGKTFTHWEWTYPDYRSREYIGIFNGIREIYRKQVQKCTLPTCRLTKTAD